MTAQNPPAGGVPASGRLTALHLLSIIETATLVILLLNLYTVHSEVITSLIGPTHGAFYLSVIAIALVTPGLPIIHRIIAAIPAIGAPVLMWLLREHGIPGIRRAGQ